MLFCDYSQIIISSSIEYFSQTKEQISLDLLRYISLQNIQKYSKKFKCPTSSIIICCDGRNYWRKNIFPNYKQNRKKDHEKSDFDWNKYFEYFNIVKNEIKNELPFRTLEINECEADDIIAVLSDILCSKSENIIISSDKDLLQIQINICSKIKQWSPFHQKFITPESNNYNLFEHIVRGDYGDGIPNILSDDDVFLKSEKRSKPIRSIDIYKWEKFGINNPELFCTNDLSLEKFRRNRKLIDLQQIPEYLFTEIKNEYNNSSINKNQNLFNYLVKHKLKKIMELGGFN